MLRLFHLRSGLKVNVLERDQPLDFRIPRGQDHALRFHAHQFRRFEIRHHHNCLSHNVFRTVFFPDSRHDLSLFGA